MIGFLYTISALLGLSVGSFLNAWIWRVRAKKSIVKGRSICTTCKVQLSWYDNIPILSYICLKGKCRSCKEPISKQYPIIEFWMLIAFTFIFWFHGEQLVLEVARDWYILAILTFIFIYDLKYGYILDRITLPAAAILFALNLIYGWVGLTDMLLGILVGAGFFLAQFVISKGRWIGGGDIRLGLLMGIILGFKLTILSLFIAYIGGALIVLILLVLKKVNKKQTIAFGTYLVFATVICMFYGSEILQIYLNLL